MTEEAPIQFEEVKPVENVDISEKLSAVDEKFKAMEAKAIEAEKTAKAAETQEPAEQANVADEVCTRCGYRKGTPIYEDPTDLDKQEFLRAVATGDRFRKVYKTLGDRVSVTFRSRTMQENDMLSLQFNRRFTSNGIDPSTLAMYSTRMGLLLCIERLEIKKDPVNLLTIYPEVSENAYPPESPADISSVLERADKKILSGKAEFMFAMLFKEYLKFNVLTETLLAKAVNADFWEATPI